MKYKVADLINGGTHWYDDLTEAEDKALEILENVRVPWTRGEWCDPSEGMFEYTKRGATGACRVFVRITRENV